MAEPFKDPLGYKTKKITLIIISVVGTAAVFIGGWMGFNVFKYRQMGGFTADMAFPAQVSISYPRHGMQLEIGQPHLIEVGALGPNPFTSLELWLDGTPVGFQEVSNGGKQSFDTQFSWLPLELGPHSLVAAAVDGQGQKVYSSQVVVLVSQGEFGIELVSLGQIGSPSVLPASPVEGATQPTEPGDGEAAEEAEIWVGTLGNWLNTYLADDSPLSPELVVRSNGCAANLLIHDLSDNEEGFVVYRQMENSPAWTQVATLSSQSKAAWITYVDEGVAGLVTYYVSAFNSLGEDSSNLALVNIDPGDCPEKQENYLVEYGQVTLHIAPGSADKVYCYHSRDRVHWNRWPMAGFLTPDEEGYLPQVPLSLVRMDGPGEYSALSYPGLMLECWGWQDGNLSKIGDLSSKEIVPDTGDSELVYGPNLSAKVVFQAVESSLLPGLFPSQMNPMDEDLSSLPSDVPISPDIPRANLSVTPDRNICGSHLPLSVQSYKEQQQYCFLFPEYDPDQGGAAPQPYLVWDFDPEPVCVGSGDEDCKTYQELLDLAAGNGGQVGFTILAIRGENKMVWNLTEPGLTTFVVPPLPCIGETAFSVRLWYRPGKEGKEVSIVPESDVSEIGEWSPSIPVTYYGPLSNWVTVPCNSLNSPTPVVTEMVQYLDFTFSGLNLSVLDDGDNVNLGTQVVELYGYFYVDAPSMGYWVEGPCYFNGIDACKDDAIDYIKIGKTRYLLLEEWGSDNGPDFINGYYPLEYESLCQSTKKLSCSYEGQNTYFKYNNNTIRIYKKLGESLFFGAVLYDYDELSDDDKVCIAHEFLYYTDPFGDYSLFDSDSGSGKCAVYVHIDQVGDPVPIELPKAPE